MKGRTPTADEAAHCNKVGELGCIVCLLTFNVRTPCSIHHTDGRTKPGAHLKILGLCGPHHQPIDKNVISFHGNKSEFEKQFGTEADLMVITNELIYGGGEIRVAI